MRPAYSTAGINREQKQEKHRTIDEKPSAFERLAYLRPGKFNKFYMFHERVSKRTCWLPIGYME